MRILIIGYGSIGQRHFNNIQQFYSEHEILVYRRQVQSDSSDSFTSDVEKTIQWKPEGVIVCNPSSYHISAARPFLQLGIPVLFEKPLASNLSLALEAEQYKSLVMVGYHLRYHPIITEVMKVLDSGKIGRVSTLFCDVGQYLPDWRPNNDYRKTVSAQASLGGGAVLELSHEINYVQALLGFEQLQVDAQLHKCSDLDIDVDDVANILMSGNNRFGHLTTVSIHLDLLQRVARRQCVIVGSDATLRLDFINKTVILSSANGDEILYSDSEFDSNQPYVDELKVFFRLIVNKVSPLTDYRDGLQTQTIIEAAKKSSSMGERQSIDLSYRQ